MRAKALSFLTLFTSTGTLLCCALPAAIATLAGGAAVGVLVTSFPWLIPISEHKGWIFLVAGTLILISASLTLRPKGAVACAITAGSGCEVAGGFTKGMLWLSVAIYLVGVFFSYTIVPLLNFLEG